MAKKKLSPKKTLQKPEAALSGLGVGSLVRIVLLATLGIGGAVLAIWVHYHRSQIDAFAPPAPSTSSSDGTRWIEIDLTSDAGFP